MTNPVFMVSEVNVNLRGGPRTLRAIHVVSDQDGRPKRTYPSIALYDDGLFADLQLRDTFTITMTAPTERNQP